MDCPPRVNISHYTHHNFRSGSAFRRVITSRLLSRGRTLTPYFPPVASYLFQRILSPGAECTCFNHLVRFAFGIHSWDFFFTTVQCVRKSFFWLSIESWQSQGFVVFRFLIGSSTSFNKLVEDPIMLDIFIAKHFSA